MGHPPHLRDHKSHAQRLPTLHPQPVQATLPLPFIRLRGTSVHFCPLAQAVSVAHWGGRVRSFSQCCHNISGTDAGGEMVAMKLESL